MLSRITFALRYWADLLTIWLVAGGIALAQNSGSFPAGGGGGTPGGSAGDVQCNVSSAFNACDTGVLTYSLQSGNPGLTAFSGFIGNQGGGFYIGFGSWPNWIGGSSAPAIYFSSSSINIEAGAGHYSDLTLAKIIPGLIYSAAGTAIPSCTSGLNGTVAVVSDATLPTYRGAYASGGAVTARVICNGATTAWLTD